MTEWTYAQSDPAEELAQLHFFTMKKRQGDGEIEFRITVKEFAVPPPGQHLRFFAEADKKVNQKDGPFVPCGWGNTLMKALADCMRAIEQFPYDGAESD